MKTIKLIDIWERITKGEEPPKKILLMGAILKYDEDLKTYIDEIERKPIDRIFNLWVVFNDEVEIIEDTPKEEIQALSRWYQPKENKKIEKLNLEFDDGFIKEHFIGSSVSYLSEYTTLKMLYEKQCEIIDKINGE